MQISFKFKSDLIAILEKLKNMVYSPYENYTPTEYDLTFINDLTSQKKFKIELDNLNLMVKELEIVLKYVENTDKKEYYEELLDSIKKLIRYLNKNEKEWFETEEYTICSDGQDRINKKYTLWEDINELIS